MAFSKANARCLLPGEQQTLAHVNANRQNAARTGHLAMSFNKDKYEL